MLFSFYTPTWQESVIIAVSQFKENCPPGRGTSVESVSERSGGGGISGTMGKRYSPSCTPSALRARPPARGTVQANQM